MNIWNKVFLVLVFLLSGVVVFLTSLDMKVRKTGEQSIESLKKGIKDSEQKRFSLLEGAAPQKLTADKTISEMGANELKLKLQNLVYERGKAWFGCIPVPNSINVDGTSLSPQQLGGSNPPTPPKRLKEVRLVEVKLTVTGPIVDRGGNQEIVPPEDLKGIVYLFEETVPAQQGDASNPDQQPVPGRAGAYLGRFTTSQPQKVRDGYQVTLTAATDLSEDEIETIRASITDRATWAVYTVVPKDRLAGLFDTVSQEKLEALISDADRRSKLADTARPLKDFDDLLTRLYQGRIVLQQTIDRSKRDIESLKVSETNADQEKKNLQTDIDFEKKRIGAMQNQVKVLQEKVDLYDEMITEIKKQIAGTQRQNEFYVAKIAEYQLHVVDLIEKRAEAAARNE